MIKHSYLKIILLVAILALVVYFFPQLMAVQDRPLVYSYQVKASYPHDNHAFTQGLIFHQGHLYESTGLYGSSSLRKVNLDNGLILQLLNLDSDVFAEGLTIINDRLYLLTWQENLGFAYDLETFTLVDQFSYLGEGWGLTYDGQHLIMSDGTAQLSFIDPKTYKIVKQITVTNDKIPVEHLNELEYISNMIYANVWLTNEILVISPKTGNVLAQVDLSALATEENKADPNAVLNGIAYDHEQERLLVTGKLWDHVYHIELVD